MTTKIENQSFLTFETLNLVPSSFCFSDIVCRRMTDMQKGKCDGY